ncbi:putative protein-signal peptide and transmembrane prediction [Winogradskyella psychrotolerans RS-3]|uniref:Uncharacterized protein n=2 Tax=Winogradskyella TaxID=286104 RepID=S7VQT3_9FLAO|nr:putative protein-signal peptide and transmembrane prediction [Winogradskyella psychrotolerans RS-3]
MLHLPGELFIEYQLAAKAERKDLFVTMAAYGDYGPFYIGPASAYSEGGYEVGTSPVTAEAEPIIMGAIKKMLHRDISKNNLDSPLVLEAESENPLRTLEQWEEKKASWKNNMASIMGTLPSRAHLKKSGSKLFGFYSRSKLYKNIISLLPATNEMR